MFLESICGMRKGGCVLNRAVVYEEGRKLEVVDDCGVRDAAVYRGARSRDHF